MQIKLIYKESIHRQCFLLNLALVNKQIGTSKHLVSWKNHGCMIFFSLDFLIHWFSTRELFPLLRENSFPNPLRLFSPLPPPDDDDEDDDDDDGGELLCFPFCVVPVPETTSSPFVTSEDGPFISPSLDTKDPAFNSAIWGSRRKSSNDARDFNCRPSDAIVF